LNYDEKKEIKIYMKLSKHIIKRRVLLHLLNFFRLRLKLLLWLLIVLLLLVFLLLSDKLLLLLILLPYNLLSMLISLVDDLLGKKLILLKLLLAERLGRFIKLRWYLLILLSTRRIPLRMLVIEIH